MTRTEAEAQIRQIPRRCRGALPEAERAKVADALRAGDLAAARLADAKGRPGCGHDFNDVVCAGPLDGKMHSYTCPDCGLSATYTAPLYVLEEEAPVAAEN